LELRLGLGTTQLELLNNVGDSLKTVSIVDARAEENVIRYREKIGAFPFD
jgi:hypothetical protein